MAKTDPTLQALGFEGLGFTELQEKSIDVNRIGFAGLCFHEVPEGTGESLIGLTGVSIEYSATERFIKVTDYRGRPLSGVSVTAKNVGGDVSDVTGVNGIAALEIDATGTTNILIKKDKTFRSYLYEFATEGTIISIVVQPRLME